MAYNALNNLIDAYIYANGVQAITGQILNGVLKQMVSQLGSGYHLMGVADPETVPASNDYAMAYFAATAGEYTDFGGITLAAGEVAVLLTYGNGSWSKQTIYNVPTTTEDLENTANFITNAVTDLVNYYTKTEVDDTLANYPTLEALATALADYYTKQEIDGQKAETDAALADRYTKSETDTKLADYYKKTETYDKGEVDSLIATLSRQEYIVAWDGLAAPDVSAIPAGVTVTYSGTTYTGTLAASASTVNKIYMVWNGTAYDMYGTSADGGYSWVFMGTTTVDLSQYATKAELSQLEAKVTDEIGIIYNEVFGVSITQPTENDKVNGYVSSGGILVPGANYCVFVDVSKLNGLHITQLNTTPGDQYAFLKSKTGNQCEFVDGTGRIDAQLNHTLVPDGAVLLYILLGSHNTDPVPVLSIDEGETKPIREELEEKQDVIVDEETRQVSFSKDSSILEYVGNYYQQGDGALIEAPSMHLYQFVAEDDIDLWWVSQTSGNDVILAIYLNGVATTANFIAPRMRNDGNTNTLPTSENKLHVAKGRLVTISYYTGDFVFAYTYAQKIFKPGILLSDEQVAQAQGGEIGEISVSVNSDYYGITMNGYDIRLIHYVNAGRNADCWTINEINKNGSVVLPSGTDVVGVLKEKNQDNFMGGYAHGNEQIVDFHILADGNAITENVNCNTVDVFMYSHLYRVSNPSENIIDRYTHINFKEGCITIETTFKCLVDNFQLDIAYNGGMWAWRQGLAQFATTNIGLLNASGSSGVSVFGTKHELISASALLGAGLVSAENILGFEQEKFKGEAYYYGNEGDTARMKIYYSTDDNSTWNNGHLCVGRAKYTMV